MANPDGPNQRQPRHDVDSDRPPVDSGWLGESSMHLLDDPAMLAELTDDLAGRATAKDLDVDPFGPGIGDTLVHADATMPAVTTSYVPAMHVGSGLAGLVDQGRSHVDSAVDQPVTTKPTPGPEPVEPAERAESVDPDPPGRLDERPEVPPEARVTPRHSRLRVAAVCLWLMAGLLVAAGVVIPVFLAEGWTLFQRLMIYLNLLGLAALCWGLAEALCVLGQPDRSNADMRSK